MSTIEQLLLYLKTKFETTLTEEGLDDWERGFNSGVAATLEQIEFLASLDIKQKP